MKKRPSTQDLLTINAINGGWSYAKGPPEWWTRSDLDVGVMKPPHAKHYFIAYKEDGFPTDDKKFDSLTQALARAIEVSS